MDKFTELEYNTLGDGLSLLARRGLLPIKEYHALLVKLASNRLIADSKPEVLICNVRFEKASENAEIAHGYALNHPRLGEQPVRTSLVLSKAADGSSFETLNTRYVIVKSPLSEDNAVPASTRVPVSQTL